MIYEIWFIYTESLYQATPFSYGCEYDKYSVGLYNSLCFDLSVFTNSDASYHDARQDKINGNVFQS